MQPTSAKCQLCQDDTWIRVSSNRVDICPVCLLYQYDATDLPRTFSLLLDNYDPGPTRRMV